MRSIDLQPIEQALAAINQSSDQEKEAFHEQEQLREKLINQPDYLKEFIDLYPDTDIQSLRQQLRLYHSAKKPAQKTKAYRLIFQIIKQSLN